MLGLREGPLTNEFDMPTKEIVKRLTVDERLARVGLPEGFTPRQATAITKARLTFALAELAENHVDEVSEWIRAVARNNPAEAIRLYMELMEFSTPRMKAAQVNLNANADVTANGKSMSAMTMDELNSIVAEG